MPPALVKIVLNVTTSLLKSLEFRQDRDKYLTFALENIKAEHSIAQSLSIILHILSTYGDNGGFSFLKVNLEDVVSRLNKEWGSFGGVAGGILRDLERYILKVRELAGEQVEKDRVNSSLLTPPFYLLHPSFLLLPPPITPPSTTFLGLSW